MRQIASEVNVSTARSESSVVLVDPKYIIVSWKKCKKKNNTVASRVISNQGTLSMFFHLSLKGKSGSSLSSIDPNLPLLDPMKGQNVLLHEERRKQEDWRKYLHFDKLETHLEYFLSEYHHLNQNIDSMREVPHYADF